METGTLATLSQVTCGRPLCLSPACLCRSELPTHAEMHPDSLTNRKRFVSASLASARRRNYRHRQVPSARAATSLEADHAASRRAVPRASMPAQRVRVPTVGGDTYRHSLGHTFVSRPLALGETLPTIARLLGHSQIQTTARYAHLARQSVKTAAIRVADSLADDLDTAPDAPPHRVTGGTPYRDRPGAPPLAGSRRYCRRFPRRIDVQSFPLAGSLSEGKYSVIAAPYGLRVNLFRLPLSPYPLNSHHTRTPVSPLPRSHR